MCKPHAAGEGEKKMAEIGISYIQEILKGKRIILQTQIFLQELDIFLKV